jgi:hypothetical protein
MHLGPGSADPGSHVPSQTSQVVAPAAAAPAAPVLEWHAAIPFIRHRLQERHPHLGADAIERCLAAAIDDTAFARIQTYRAILVERRADLSLGRLDHEQRSEHHSAA